MNLLATLTLFAQAGKNAAEPTPEDAAGAFACLGACLLPFLIVGGILVVVGVLIGWKVFSKAGRPGWESLVPIYSHWILVTEIAKKEPLWFFLMFIPLGNIIAAWVICMEVAKKFGKTETFGIGLFFLGPICWAMLAFGSAEYQGGKSSKKKSKGGDDDDNW